MQPERRQYLRRASDRDPGLDRDDLFLLMESYRNTIELNTTLLERQDTLNQGLERVLHEIGNVCSHQMGLTAEIGKLPREFRDLIDALSKGTATLCDELKKTIEGNRKDEAAEHSKHTVRMYGAFAALTTIIISLIGIILKLWPGT